jgi:hypothetical protein
MRSRPPLAPEKIAFESPVASHINFGSEPFSTQNIPSPGRQKQDPHESHFTAAARGAADHYRPPQIFFHTASD